MQDHVWPLCLGLSEWSHPWSRETKFLQLHSTEELGKFKNKSGCILSPLWSTQDWKNVLSLWNPFYYLQFSWSACQCLSNSRNNGIPSHPRLFLRIKMPENIGSFVDTCYLLTNCPFYWQHTCSNSTSLLFRVSNGCWPFQSVKEMVVYLLIVSFYSVSTVLPAHSPWDLWFNLTFLISSYFNKIYLNLKSYLKSY